MKLNYYAATDSLYIDLSEQPSVESREISEGIVLDYDLNGALVGIDIDNASRKPQGSTQTSAGQQAAIAGHDGCCVTVLFAQGTGLSAGSGKVL